MPNAERLKYHVTMIGSKLSFALDPQRKLRGSVWGFPGDHSPQTPWDLPLWRQSPRGSISERTQKIARYHAFGIGTKAINPRRLNGGMPVLNALLALRVSVGTTNNPGRRTYLLHWRVSAVKLLAVNVGVLSRYA